MLIACGRRCSGCRSVHIVCNASDGQREVRWRRRRRRYHQLIPAYINCQILTLHQLLYQLQLGLLDIVVVLFDDHGRLLYRLHLLLDEHGLVLVDYDRLDHHRLVIEERQRWNRRRRRNEIYGRVDNSGSLIVFGRMLYDI